MDAKSTRAKWLELHQQWQEKHVVAKFAAAAVFKAHIAFAEGKGAGPQSAQISHAAETAKEAERLRDQMDQLIHELDA